MHFFSASRLPPQGQHENSSPGLLVFAFLFEKNPFITFYFPNFKDTVFTTTAENRHPFEVTNAARR